ncbi:CIA30 family protein [Shewanella sp. GXUN23E]|uniref:CIA30 family protein n=1 Tax=Shewanella sp. GXUN23E TaxID=3422498 RepID=UPI003D7DF268
MKLFDFSTLDSARDWYSINDGVMGGLSRSRLSASPLGFAVFSGHVSLANGGGFASVRCDFADTNLSAAGYIRLLVKGDGRQYKVNLRDSLAPDSPVYQQAFVSRADDDVWQQVNLPLTEFHARRRGQPLPGISADFSAIKSLGLVIGDRQGGDFTLQILSVEAV